MGGVFGRDKGGCGERGREELADEEAFRCKYRGNADAGCVGGAVNGIRRDKIYEGECPTFN